MSSGIRWGLVICGLFVAAPPIRAQNNLNLSGASNCTMADFDTTLQFVDGPDDYYSIVVNQRNLSNHECVFDGPRYGINFVPVSPHYGPCHDCSNNPPLTLNPGQTAQHSYRWKTTPAKAEETCLQPDWMSGPVLVVGKALLKPVCSEVEESRLSLAAPSDSTNQPAPRFNLTSTKSTYYAGENFAVRVALAEPPAGVPSGTEPCPTLYLRERSPDGTTRIDEVHPMAFKSCGRPILGHQMGDWKSGLELGSGANSRWAGVGEHTMEVFQMDPPASSNVLRIRIADPETIPRQWAKVEGVAANITLDKDTYRVGEDVPLHIAVANLDAKAPVYSADAVWDPCFVVAIEVDDAGGHALPVEQRFLNWSMCSGHGFGPKPYAPGKVVALERSLGAEGWLPNRPGTYTVVVTWGVATDAAAAVEGSPPALKPYATVRALAVFRVVEADQ